MEIIRFAKRSTRRSFITQSKLASTWGIVNAGQLEIYEEIPKELLEKVEDVLLNRRPDATDRLLEFSETVKSGKRKENVENLEWREAPC